MARYRKKARSVRRGFSRKTRSRSGSSSNPMNVLIPAALYGAGRPYISGLVSPISSMLPLGQYADEAVLGIGGYFLAKKGRGMIKNIGTAMLTVEAASIGSQLIGNVGGSNSGGAF